MGPAWRAAFHVGLMTISMSNGERDPNYQLHFNKKSALQATDPVSSRACAQDPPMLETIPAAQLTQLLPDFQYFVLWQNQGTPDSKQVVYHQLVDRLKDPLRCINQGQHRFCGAAAFLAMLAIAKPTEYVAKVLRLYAEGVPNVNAGDDVYRVEAGIDFVDWMTMVAEQVSCVGCNDLARSVADPENQGMAKCCFATGDQAALSKFGNLESWSLREDRDSEDADTQWQAIIDFASGKFKKVVFFDMTAAGNEQEWKDEHPQSENKFKGNHVMMLTWAGEGQCVVWSYAKLYTGLCTKVRKTVSRAWGVDFEGFEGKERVAKMKEYMSAMNSTFNNFEDEFYVPP